MRVKDFVCLILILLLLACGNSPKGNSEYVSVADNSITEVDEEDGKGGYDDYTDGSDDSAPALGNITKKSRVRQMWRLFP